MNKSLKIVLLLLFLIQSGTLTAQKIGYIDSEYILNKHPDYKVIQDQLTQLGSDWKKEAQSLDSLMSKGE